MSHTPQPLAEAEVVDQETLEKYDRESRTRKVETTFLKWPVTIVAVALSVYHVWTALLGAPVAGVLKILEDEDAVIAKGAVIAQVE